MPANAKIRACKPEPICQNAPENENYKRVSFYFLTTEYCQKVWAHVITLNILVLKPYKSIAGIFWDRFPNYVAPSRIWRDYFPSYSFSGNNHISLLEIIPNDTDE